MMNHMLEAFDRGEDIGHYGRLTFAMVACHFVDNDELVELLRKDHDADEQEVHAMIQQVKEKDYSPPRRENAQARKDTPVAAGTGVPDLPDP
jgi:hypothetical protein